MRENRRRVLAASVVLGLASIRPVTACSQITPGQTGTGCTALQACTDTSAMLGAECKTTIAGGFYCQDFAQYGADCNACSCSAGCEADGGSGSPQDWRPGLANPYGSGTSANGGPIDLSALQKTNLVAQHNFVRAYHGACALEWSDAVAQNVKDTAMASWSSCTLEHTTNAVRANKAGFSSLGENLASASSMYYANNFPVDLKTMAWYLEEYDWDYQTSATKAGGGAS
eukprot:Hpha_TRINITY_DN16639_c1_g6::TRINITY_DN16639_c1_g6_i1::g.183623::m.183623